MQGATGIDPEAQMRLGGAMATRDEWGRLLSPDMMGRAVPIMPIERQSDAPEWANALSSAANVGTMTTMPEVGALGEMLKATEIAKTGIKAYHGSPHDFERFDMSKIGTGEGAQVYGHGLYFAENPAVAAEYKKALTKWSGAVEIQTPSRAGFLDDSPSTFERFFAARFREHQGDLTATKDALMQDLRAHPGDKTIQAAIDFANTKDAQFNIRDHAPGKTYEVSINADPEHFLDWDKPLSEQSDAVKKAVSSLLPNEPDLHEMYGSTVADLLRGTEYDPQIGPRAANSPEYATEALRAAGIKGIRYKDQGSRGAEGGTHNYVVFDDKIIDILKKYGIAGLTAGGAAAAASSQPPSVRDSVIQAMQGGT